MDELQLAGCIFLDKQGRILLMHRRTEKYDHWEVPGGKIEPGETDAAAAIREVQEELGVAANIVRKLGEASFVDGRPMHYHWFLAETSDRPTICEPDKFEDIGYFVPNELMQSGVSLSEGAKSFVSLVKMGGIRL